jgi:hypothetical protein
VYRKNGGMGWKREKEFHFGHVIFGCLLDIQVGITRGDKEEGHMDIEKSSTGGSNWNGPLGDGGKPEGQAGKASEEGL